MPTGSAEIPFRHAPEKGLVSVIIPTYNRARVVRRAIDSALRQSYARLEVVVMDDGSTDDTKAVVRAAGDRVRYFHQPNAGVSAARNGAMAEARGEFIAFLDSDDVWHDWKVEAQVAGLTRYPEVGIVWTDMSAVDARGRITHDRYIRKMYGAYKDVDVETAMTRVGTLSELHPVAPPKLAAAPVRVGDLSSAILLGNLLHTSTVVFRRAWADGVGGLRWSNGGEDYEYYTRLCACGLAMMIDAPSTLYRVGADDQLTLPHLLLPIARNNLRTVRARFAERGRNTTLTPADKRRRLAWSLQWVGVTAFDAGLRLEAARHLAASLRVKPGVDHRLVYLASCALPHIVVDALRAIRRRLRAPIGNVKASTTAPGARGGAAGE